MFSLNNANGTCLEQNPEYININPIQKNNLVSIILTDNLMILIKSVDERCQT